MYGIGSQRSPWTRRIRRRALLVRAAAGGSVAMLGAAAAACSSSNNGNTNAKNAAPATQGASQPTVHVTQSGTTPGAQASATHAASAAGTLAATNLALRLAIGSEPETLDIGQFRAGTSLYYGLNVFEQLLKRDVTGKLGPGLATSYSVSPDGTEFTFNLRPGAKFHNGDPVTASDIQFSFERYVDPKLNNVFAYQLAGLQGIDIVNDSTVKIRLKSYDATFLPGGGFAYILPKNYITDKGDSYFAEHPVGTGPWSYVSREIKQNFKLTRFDDWWGQKPAFKDLIFNIIPDDNARVSALQSNQVDFISQLAPQFIDQLKADNRLRIVEGFLGDNIFIIPNTKVTGKPWSDVRVRQAMDFAIDKQTIITKILGGLGIPEMGVAANDDGFGPDLKQRPYDVPTAKKLMNEAGCANGFSFDYFAPVNGRLPNSEQLTQAVAGYWNSIGIKTNVQLISYSQWVDKEKGDSELNGVCFGLWGDSTFDPGARINGTLPRNGPYSHTSDDKVEAMVTQINSEIDANKRVQEYIDLFKYVQDQALQIYVYGARGAFGMTQKVNWTPWAGVAYTIMENAVPV